MKLNSQIKDQILQMSSFNDFCQFLFSSALSGGGGGGGDMRVTSIQDCARVAEDLCQKKLGNPQKYSNVQVATIKERLLYEMKAHIASKLEEFKTSQNNKTYLDTASPPTFLPLDELEAARSRMLEKKINMSGNPAFKGAVAKFEEKIAEISDCIKCLKVQKSFDYDTERLAGDLEFIFEEFPFDSVVFYCRAKNFISSEQGRQDFFMANQLSLCCEKIEYFFNIKDKDVADICILDRWQVVCQDLCMQCLAEVEGIVNKNSFTSFKEVERKRIQGGVAGDDNSKDIKRLLSLKNLLQLKDENLLISQYYSNKLSGQSSLNSSVNSSPSSASTSQSSNFIVSDSVIICDVKRGIPSRISAEDAAILSSSIELALGTANLMVGSLHYNPEVIGVFQEAVKKLQIKSSGI